MDEHLRIVLEQFKAMLEKRLMVHELILFGSRARGDAHAESDVDVVVILEGEVGERQRDYISDCSWEIGFNNRLVLSPVSFSRDEWEHGPERASILGQSIKAEGIPV